MSATDHERDRREFDRLASEFLNGRISRRDFLKGAGAMSTALAFSGTIASILAACAPGPTAEPTAETTTGEGPGYGPVQQIPPSPRTRGPLGEEPADSSELQLTEDQIAELSAMDLKAAILWPASFQFYQVAADGIRSELDRVGAEVFSVVDHGYDPQGQAAAVDNVLGGNPDMIFTWVVDNVQGAAGFQAAVDQGVILSLMSNLPEGYQHPDDYAGIVTDDLFGMGQAAAEMMADVLGGEGQVGWIFHDANAYVTNQRDNAFKETIETQFPGIEIVAEGGFATPEQAFEIARSMVLQNPDLAGIYAAWAVPAASAAEALRAEGRDDIKIVTLDLDPTIAVDMASEGNVAGIVADVPFEIGRGMAVGALWRLVGEAAPPFAIVPHMKVTRDNLITAWRESLKQDPPPEVMQALGY